MSGVDSNTSAQFQGLPPAQSLFVTGTGGVDNTWYRFFQTLWLQISSGASSQLTLVGAHQAAGNASNDAAAASAAVVTESNRAQAAEASLQGQINTLTGEITSLQNQINGLQTQINTINTRLTNAGIP